MNAYELIITVCTIIDTVITLYNIYKASKDKNDNKVMLMLVQITVITKE